MTDFSYDVFLNHNANAMDKSCEGWLTEPRQPPRAREAWGYIIMDSI
jgi:hypothetical protein